MKHLGLVIGSSVLVAFGVFAMASATGTNADNKTAAVKAPVLVELFTSEGCSSCPPADRLLAKLEKTDTSVIVLSEHVTYWNGIGWRDPYSTNESTGRQSDYVERLRLDSSYTPQMVVNGRYQFVGSDEGSADSAIRKAAQNEAVPVTISNLQPGENRVTFSIATGNVAKNAQVLVVMAQDEGSQQVASGENGGHTLHHVQIARSIRQVANVPNGSAYNGDLSVDLPHPIAGSGWHIVVFLQQGSGGPILGAASQAV
jgi:hypothetical protein